MSEPRPGPALAAAQARFAKSRRRRQEGALVTTLRNVARLRTMPLGTTRRAKALLNGPCAEMADELIKTGLAPWRQDTVEFLNPACWRLAMDEGLGSLFDETALRGYLLGVAVGRRLRTQRATR